MTTLTSPPTTLAPLDSGFLSVGVAPTDVTITVLPLYKYSGDTKTKQGFDSTAGIGFIQDGDKVERFSFSSSAVNSTTKITTLSGCTRGLSQTSTTASFAAGTGGTFAKGARVYLVHDITYIQSAVFTNVASTFTATQAFAGATFSAAPTFAKGEHNTPFADATARDAYFTSPTNGDEAYTTGIGKQVYSGGAWVTINASSTSIATDHAAGTVDLASTTETAAGTATDATSGAANVIPVSIVKKNSTGAVSGTVPMLNTAVMLDGSIGGIGVATPVLGALLIGGGAGLAMTPIGPGTTGQVPVSNGTTLAMGTPPSYGTPVAFFYADTTGVGTSSTATVDVPTHQYTIPANDLINGVGYEFFWSGTASWGAGTINLRVQLGSTVICGPSVIPTATGNFVVQGKLLGTAAAGASVAVRGLTEFHTQSGGTNSTPVNYGSANVATNGSLVLKLNIDYTSSNGTNSFVSSMCVIRKISTSAF